MERKSAGSGCKYGFTLVRWSFLSDRRAISASLFYLYMLHQGEVPTVHLKTVLQRAP